MSERGQKRIEVLAGARRFSRSWFAHFAAIDNPASSKLTQERLGWRPVQPALIPDLDGEPCFKILTREPMRTRTADDRRWTAYLFTSELFSAACGSFVATRSKHLDYAAARTNSEANGMTSKFGWLQALATTKIVSFLSLCGLQPSELTISWAWYWKSKFRRFLEVQSQQAVDQKSTT